MQHAGRVVCPAQRCAACSLPCAPRSSVHPGAPTCQTPCRWGRTCSWHPGPGRTTRSCGRSQKGQGLRRMRGRQRSTAKTATCDVPKQPRVYYERRRGAAARRPSGRPTARRAARGRAKRHCSLHCLEANHKMQPAFSAAIPPTLRSAAIPPPHPSPLARHILDAFSHPVWRREVKGRARHGRYVACRHEGQAQGRVSATKVFHLQASGCEEQPGSLAGAGTAQGTNVATARLLPPDPLLCLARHTCGDGHVINLQEDQQEGMQG